MKKLNIGIIAHVDAGKTTLTENILFIGGAISKKGRVDSGDTQTDSMDVERRRGISVRAAATSFYFNGIKFNLIDTPGHVDFIAEVERSLRVLDGVVLLISAKEGLQSQTRVFMDVIKTQKIPAVIFINKIDRLGADVEKITNETNVYMGGRLILTQRVLPGNKIYSFTDNEIMAGSIDVLCTLDDCFMEKYLNDEQISSGHFMEKLTHCTRNGDLYPVFYGSALYGIGVLELLEQLPLYLPMAYGDNNAPLSGVVFKIDNSGNEKHVYVRIYQGSIKIRNMIKYRGKEEKATRLAGLASGAVVSQQVIEAGDIGILYFKDMRVFDIIGEPGGMRDISLGRPTIIACIQPKQPEQKRELYEALTLLADEDPILDFTGETMLLRMFGEIQMEILQELLLKRYGIPVLFSNSMTIYMETPAISAYAFAPLGKKGSGTYFRAGVGFRIYPLPRGSGLQYITEVSFGNLEKPFQTAVEEAVYETCKHGIYGWEITDCQVIFDFYEYDSVTSTPSDYRNLTPLVLMEAFQNAGMELLEPILEFELHVPANSAGKALADCERMRAGIIKTETSLFDGSICITGLIPADSCKTYAAHTASYTEGSGVFVTKFYGYKNTVFDQSKVNEKEINLAVNKTVYLMHKHRAI